MWPFSSRMYQSVLTPASTATSSRRSPGTRRLPPPAGSPTCSGASLARRLARNSRISARLSTAVTLRRSARARGVEPVPPIDPPSHAHVNGGCIEDVRGASDGSRPQHENRPQESPTAVPVTEEKMAMPPRGVRGPAPAAPAEGRSRPRAALAAALLGFFVITLDAVIVNVVLPSIRQDLGGGVTGLQWVVDGYTLMFAALLLSAGSLADRIGARRAFGLGLVVFVAASVACGLAPGLGSLVVARFVQGSAAAVMMPSAMALLREAFPDPGRRARALGMWAMGGAAASSSGPVLGGLLDVVDWRLVFFINVPVGVVA